MMIAAGLVIGEVPVEQISDSANIIVSQVRPSGFFDGAYRIEKAWDKAGEEEFSRWVETIGTAREKKVFRLAEGLRNPAINPLYTPEDDDLRFQADCATFAYGLRTYFAYKTGRPFSFIGNKGRRYRYGNRPQIFRDFSQYTSTRRFMNAALAAVSSGHFRMNARLEGTDTYPIDVTPESIRPGVTYYDPAGHVLVVYRVDPVTGHVYMMDGHPDGTVTMKRLNKKMYRGSSRSGGGFRAWRQFDVQLLDDQTGAFRISRKLNRDSAHYSATAQYRRTYELDGIELGYHEWVRARLSGGPIVDPALAFGKRVDRVCGQLLDRAIAVDAAALAGLPDEAGPKKLPRKFLWGGTRWHRHATAVLDTRLRGEVEELGDFVARTLIWAEKDDPRLLFAGSAEELSTLYRDALAAYEQQAGCMVFYVNSAGEEIQLSITEVLARLKRLSFDPNHCPELRWGAEGDELATCLDSDAKLSRYRKEAWLRRRTRLLTRPHLEKRPRLSRELATMVRPLLAR